MRKILLIIIIILIVVLGYVTLTNGIKIGNFQVFSIAQIAEQSKTLKTKIEEVNTLIDVDYPKKMSELKTASNYMKTAKKEYLEYTNLSSDEDIINARTEKNYTIEFLWAKLGTHARNEGINLKFEIVQSSIGASTVNDLSFTIDGSYIAITNFIYAIENDSELDFRIQNFKLLPYQNEILRGTFTVKNIAIQGNTSTQTVTTTQGQTQEQQQNNTANGASTEADTNTVE